MSSPTAILVEMQKIDDQISAKEKIKVSLPLQLEQLNISVKNAEDFLAEIKQQLETNSQNQKALELEVMSNKETILKYKHQLDGIKTNKEYKALNSQIAQLEDKNIKIEEDILQVMDEETNLKKLQDEGKIKKKLADENLKANENIIKEDIQKVDNEIEALKATRSKFGSQIPRDLAKKYVQLIKNKNYKAVAYNNGNSCSCCGFHIRPQVVIELNDINKILYCENCGRILVNRY